MNLYLLETYLQEALTQSNKTLGENRERHLEDGTLAYDTFREPGTKEDPFLIICHSPYANYSETHSLHRHDYLEIEYLYRGKARQYFTGHNVDMDEGDILVMDTNVRHGVDVFGDDTILVNILITRKLFERSILRLISGNPLLYRFYSDSLFSKTGSEECILFHQNTDSDATEFLQRLLLEYYLQKPCSEMAMQSYLTLCFTELFRNNLYQREVREKKETDFSEILTYVSDHLDTVSLQSLAEYFHYSPSYLSRLFKQVTGKTFARLVHDQKLERATELLQNTTISVNTIAETLGYYDQSHFTHVFKDEFGVSPQEYRRQNVS